MTAVRLVQLARVAREVAETVLPPYRTPFSKHLYTQPQLLTLLCLMRSEGWTDRETVVVTQSTGRCHGRAPGVAG